MSLKVKGLFKFRRSTNDLSEWNKTDEKLAQAINENDLNKVDTLLLKKSVVPTKLDQHGTTLFHKACSEGKFEVVTLFLAHKADTNAIDSGGRTALHSAAQNGYDQICAKLLQVNNNSYATDNYNLTPLHYACISGSEECAKILLANDAPVDHTDKEGRTGLFMAAQLSHISVCKLLIDHGCNVNHRDGQNRTALMVAAEFGNKEVCEMLVRRGANTLFADDNGHNASWYAVKGDHLEVKVIIDQAPSIASWDLAKRSSKQSSSDESHRHADQIDEVSPFDDTRSSIDPLENAIVPLDEFSDEDSSHVRKDPTQEALEQKLEETLKFISSKQITRPTSGTDQSSASREPSPPGPPIYRSSSVSEGEEKEQKVVDINAFKELEEEHEVLNEELKKVNTENRNLLQKLQKLQSKTNSGNEDQFVETRIHEMEQELKDVKGKLGEAHNRGRDLEEEVTELRKQLDQDSKPEAEQNGDSWNDTSDEEEQPPERKKIGAKENKLVAVLRSQVSGLTKENDQLRERLQIPSVSHSLETGILPKSSSSGPDTGAEETSTVYQQLQAAQETQVKKLNQHIQQLQDDNFSLSAQLSDAVEKKAELAIEKDELEEKFVDLRNSQHELEQQLQQIQLSVETLRNKTSSPEEIKGLAELSGGKTLLEAQLDNLQDEITVLRSKSGTPVQSSTDLAAQLQAEVIRLEEQNVSLKQELQELNQLTLDVRVQKETHQKEKEELQHENRQLMKSVEDVQRQMRDVEELSEFNVQLREETERLKGDVTLMKRESKLSRKADKTGQDSLVLLNRELQQENNDLKSKNRTLTAQLREAEGGLAQKNTVRSREPDIKYVDALIKENSELKEEVGSLQAMVARQQDMNDIGQSSRSNKKLAQDYLNLQQESERMKEHMEKLQEEIAKLKKQNGMLQSEVQDAREQIDRDAAAAAQVEKTIQQEKEALQNEIARLRPSGQEAGGTRHRRRSGGSTSSESSSLLDKSFSADEQVKEDIKELKQKFRATAGSLKRERSSTDAENSRLKDKIKDLQINLQAVRKSQEEQNRFHHVMMQTKAELEEENTKLKETVQELTKEARVKGSVTRVDSKVFEDLAKFQEENEELKKGIIEYSEKWRAKTEKYEKKILDLRHSKIESQKEVDNLKIAVEAAGRLEGEYDRVDLENKELKKEILDLKYQLKALRIELNNKEKISVGEIEDLRTKNAELEKSLSKLQEELQSQKEIHRQAVAKAQEDNSKLASTVQELKEQSTGVSVNKDVSSLVDECNSVDEMVDKLHSEKLEAINGNFDEALKRKISDLEKEVTKLKDLLRKAKEDSESSSSSESSGTRFSSREKQLKLQIETLKQRLGETDRKHREVVSTYRTHLISAVQGHIDPEVKEAVAQIIKLRSTEQFC